VHKLRAQYFSVYYKWAKSPQELKCAGHGSNIVKWSTVCSSQAITITFKHTAFWCSTLCSYRSAQKAKQRTYKRKTPASKSQFKGTLKAPRSLTGMRQQARYLAMTLQPLHYVSRKGVGVGKEENRLKWSSAAVQQFPFHRCQQKESTFCSVNTETTFFSAIYY